MVGPVRARITSAVRQAHGPEQRPRAPGLLLRRSSPGPDPFPTERISRRRGGVYARPPCCAAAITDSVPTGCGVPDTLNLGLRPNCAGSLLVGQAFLPVGTRPCPGRQECLPHQLCCPCESLLAGNLCNRVMSFPSRAPSNERLLVGDRDGEVGVWGRNHTRIFLGRTATTRHNIPRSVGRPVCELSSPFAASAAFAVRCHLRFRLSCARPGKV